MGTSLAYTDNANRSVKVLACVAKWAYARPYHSNAERLDPLTPFFEEYNHYRPHGGIGGAPPASLLWQRPWKHS